MVGSMAEIQDLTKYNGIDEFVCVRKQINDVASINGLLKDELSFPGRCPSYVPVSEHRDTRSPSIKSH